MPDTIRTLAELNGIFADNDTGDASTQDIRDLLQSMLVHAVIGTINNATPITVTTTPQAVEMANELHARHLTVDLGNNRITTPAELTSARYDLGWELNVQGQPGGDGVYIAAIFNGASKIQATERKFSIVNGEWKQIYFRIPGVSIAGGDNLSLGIERETGSGDILIENAQLSVQRLGIE